MTKVPLQKARPMALKRRILRLRPFRVFENPRFLKERNRGLRRVRTSFISCKKLILALITQIPKEDYADFLYFCVLAIGVIGT
jgi:hypothetical protein